MTAREPREDDAATRRLYSDAVRQLFSLARQLVSAERGHHDGDYLREALQVAKETERLVAIAVVVERARGTTWDTIGQVDGGITKQSAQKKWADSITTLGHLTDGPDTDLPHNLKTTSGAEQDEEPDTRQTSARSFALNGVFGSNFGNLIQVAGGISGDVNIAPTPDLLSKLQDTVNLPILAFLVNFENCLEEMGDLQAQLDFIPQGMWPVIDSVAYGQADMFLQRSGLGDVPSPPETSDVRDALAFLLKVAFERGYFMFHFHRLDYIPRPVHPADPMAIMDLIFAEDDHARRGRSQGNAIEVTLRRAVSQSTEPDTATRTLQMLGDHLLQTVQPHLDLWCDIVRSAHAYGILAARAETMI